MASQEQKDGSPIDPAQLRQRPQRLVRRCLRIPGFEHHRPASGGEQTFARRFGGGHRRHATFLFGWRKISKSNNTPRDASETISGERNRLTHEWFIGIRSCQASSAPFREIKVARASTLARDKLSRKPEACATSDHAELHPSGFADHVLIPRRIPDELHIS